MYKKNKIISFLSVVLAIFMILTTCNVITATNEEMGEKIKVVKHEVKEVSESLELTNKIYLKENNLKTTNIPITSAPEDEFYPTIGIGLDGTLGFAYTFQSDFFTSEVPWFYSTDDGNTWEGALVWNIEGIQTGPAIAYTGSDRYFVGSLQDPINDDGANQWLFQMVDISDSETWEGSMWSWAASYPYRDRGIPDIAGYDGIDFPGWRHVTLCIGTRDERVNMPIFNYLNYEDEGSGWSSYHDTFQGCENSAIDIDQTNGYFYGVIDHFNQSRGDWDLILMPGDCHPTEDLSLTYFDYQILGGTKNTKLPDVGANGGTVMIVAQQDELIPGKNDIVCYYSSNNGQNWEMSIVAGDTMDDEINPTIVVYGDSATCTFAIDNNLYSCHTIDGGATWTEPEKINNQDNTFVNERRNSAITNGGYAMWTDNRNGNNDIFFDNIGFPPAAVIEISGITGGIGVSATLSNIGGADATNLQWSIDLDGGLILLGHKEGTISTLAPGASQTIKLPLVIGLGSSTITVEAGGIQQQADCKVLLFFVIGIE